MLGKNRFILLCITTLLILTMSVFAVRLADFSGTFVEGFETNFFTNGWNSQSPWATSQADSFAGAKSAIHVNSTGSQDLSISVNTSAFLNITVSYYRKLILSGATLQASWNDGSSWSALETINSSNTWTQSFFALPVGAQENGNVTFRFRCSSPSVSAGCFLDNVIVTGALNDTTPPFYTNLVEPADPSTYDPGANYTFQSTWYDNVDVNNVIFTFDGTNYNPSKSGQTYTSILGPLGVGTYNYQWYADDQKGNSNSTGILTFTVNQATTTTALYLNGTQGDATVEYLGPANITGTTTMGTAVLERNGTVVSNPENSSALNVGTYVYRAYNPGTVNYTSSSSSNYTLTVVDTTPPGNVTNIQASSTMSTITWTWNNPSDIDFSHFMVYVNGTYMTNTSTTSYQATDLQKNTNYTITLVGYDIRGNSATVGVHTAKTTLTDKPKNLGGGQVMQFTG